MVKPTQGLSAVPLLLAVAALVAASASIGLAAGESRNPSERLTTSAGARSPARQDTESAPARYARVEGQVTTLAPAGDPTGADVGSSRALCPAGMRVIGGGYQAITGGGETFYSDALTSGRAGWAVGAANKLATSGTVQAFAYCVRFGRTATANRRTLARRRAAVRRQMTALGDRYRDLRAAQF
jgi:hypothetical protein